jgi:hypothetical protein
MADVDSEAFRQQIVDMLRECGLEDPTEEDVAKCLEDALAVHARTVGAFNRAAVVPVPDPRPHRELSRPQHQQQQGGEPHTARGAAAGARGATMPVGSDGDGPEYSQQLPSSRGASPYQPPSSYAAPPAGRDDREVHYAVHASRQTTGTRQQQHHHDGGVATGAGRPTTGVSTTGAVRGDDNISPEIGDYSRRYAVPTGPRSRGSPSGAQPPHHPHLGVPGGAGAHHRDRAGDRISTTSVRGTPVVGGPRLSQSGRGFRPDSIGFRSPSPNFYYDPATAAGSGAIGGEAAAAAGAAHHRAATRQQAMAAAGRRTASLGVAGGERRQGAIPAAVPGYLSKAYADHLRQRVDGQLEAAEVKALDGDAPFAEDELPADTRVYRHQRRFEPFVATSTRSRGGAGSGAGSGGGSGPRSEQQQRTSPAPAAATGDDVQQQPATARGTAGSGSGSGGRRGGQRAAGSKGEASAGDHDISAVALRSKSAASSDHYMGAADTSARRRAMALEHSITSVIYGPLGSKTYLAGGFRSRSAKAPVANPRLGPPRRVTDPVRRYAQMRECWNRDGFLASQKGQRRDLRWAVRQSMTEWHPDDLNTVEHMRHQYV